MAQNKILTMQPVAVANSATNVLAPAAAGASGVGYTATASYLIVRHIRVVNKTAGAVTITCYIGATGASAAGTEFAWNATSVPANSYLDWYGQVRLEGATGFLVALASAATSLSIQCDGEIGLV